MRASGLSLNDYFQKNIFEPLGLKNINMYPTPEMRKSFAYMQQTDANGSTMTRDHLYRRPLKAETDAEKKAIFNSGGAGCFARPVEYCRKLRVPSQMIDDVSQVLTSGRDPCYPPKRRHLPDH